MTHPVPSVGRVVHYRPDRHLDRDWCFAPATGDRPLAAIVTSVEALSEGGHLVTVTVFQPVGAPHALGRMISKGTEPGCWSWPPRS